MTATSLQTRIARAAADDAKAAWDRHKGACFQCGRKGRNVLPCPAGVHLQADARDLRRAAQEEAQADKVPADGQEALFPVTAVSRR